MLEERAKLRARSALDGVPRRPARHRREADPSRRARCRPGPHPRRASRRGARATSIAQRQPGYVDGDRHAAARRPDVRAGARAGRRRAQVHRRHDAHDRRAEHGAALGQRGGPARRSTRRSAAIDLGRAGRRHDQPTSRACPGTDTCKLGISSSRALAAELRPAAASVGHRQGPERQATCTSRRSGCFNSCGQHHVADLGFLGVEPQRRRAPRAALPAGRRRPVDEQRRLVRPGHRRGAVEARARGGQAPDRALRRRSARASESFADFANRIGKKTIRAMVEELQALPTYDQDPSFYSDWGDPREYTIADMGEGECAGEVVPLVEVELAGAEREIFEAQVLLDEKQDRRRRGVARLLARCCIAARALDPREELQRGRRRRTRSSASSASTSTTRSCSSIRSRAASSRSTSSAPTTSSSESAPSRARRVHQLIEEATLFVDAAHQCYTRLGSALKHRDACAPPSARPDEPMDAHKLQLKIYADARLGADARPEAFIPVFHRWIKKHAPAGADDRRRQLRSTCPRGRASC